MNRSIDSSLSKEKLVTKVKMMNLKSQLKLYLEMRDMTAAELSRKASVSKQVISQWLQGSAPKRLDQVKKVASALSTTVDHLCFGDGRDIESQKVTELDALLGNGWLSGHFEVRLRRIKGSGGSK